MRRLPSVVASGGAISQLRESNDDLSQGFHQYNCPCEQHTREAFFQLIVEFSQLRYGPQTLRRTEAAAFKLTRRLLQSTNPALAPGHGVDGECAFERPPSPSWSVIFPASVLLPRSRPTCPRISQRTSCPRSRRSRACPEGNLRVDGITVELA